MGKRKERGGGGCFVCVLELGEMGEMWGEFEIGRKLYLKRMETRLISIRFR